MNVVLSPFSLQSAAIFSACSISDLPDSLNLDALYGVSAVGAGAFSLAHLRLMLRRRSSAVWLNSTDLEPGCRFAGIMS